MKPRRVRVRLAVAGLGSALALGIEMHAAGAAPDSPRPQGAPHIYQKSRSFLVPFHFDPAERTRRRELQLWVSEDAGRTWSHQGTTTPDRPAFTFRCEKDGEYWLAVRTVDAEGRLHPADDARIQPSMKVVVDTTPPSVVLEKQVRSASLASIRWEVRDDHPGRKPPYIEYQVEGSNDWRPVPGDITGTLGVATWDSGYAEPLKIRATILDCAGNRGQAILEVPSCIPVAPALAAAEPAADKVVEPKARPTPPEATPRPAPAVAVIEPPAQPRPQDEAARPATVAVAEVAPDGLPPAGSSETKDAPVEEAPAANPAASPTPPVVASIPPPREALPEPEPPPRALTAASPPRALAETAMSASLPAATNPAGVLGERADTAVTPARAHPSALAEAGSAVNPMSPGERPAPPADPRDLPTDRVLPTAPDAGVGRTRMAAAPGAAAVGASAKQIPTLKVDSPRFSLDYAVEHAGAEGRPALVELWVTRDAGKTWIRRSKDSDRLSPVQVELEGEGRYGLSLIARDAKGMGDRPPAPGDPPQMWVEVPARPEVARKPASFFQRAFRR